MSVTPVLVSLPVITLPTVVLPGATVTLSLDAPDRRAAVEAARSSADGRVALASPDGLAPGRVVVTATVPSVGNLPNGDPVAIVQVDGRARTVEVADADGVGRLSVELLDDNTAKPPLERTTQELRATLELIAELRRSRRLPEILRTLTAPGALADAVATWAELASDDLGRILRAVDPSDRVDAVLAWARRHLAELQIAETIRNDVSEGMDQHQREFLLRQQLAAIRKELGDDDDDTADEFRTRLAELDAPDAVKQAIAKELDRYDRMSSQSPEHSWIRTWLDRIFEMPWGVTSDDELDLAVAKEQLDADHYGLDDVKDRIVEFLATRKLRHDRGLDRAPNDGQDQARDGSASDRAWRGPRPDGSEQTPAEPSGGGRNQNGSASDRAWRGPRPDRSDRAGVNPSGGGRHQNGSAGDRAAHDEGKARDGSASDRAWRGPRHNGSEQTPAEPSGGGRNQHGRNQGGAIITLVGPPGVGKTSLGASIAEAMGRRFVRVALGGIRDEAEIRGHRRTYVGSQPGRIVRALQEAGTMNPVILLDEVDKLAAGGWSGDPTAALLEVLDPAQNHTFRDHYLEVDLDLSQVVFIATANVADTIPAPLLDRMDLVRLDGYTSDEKVFIAERYLVPRQIEQSGLTPDEIAFEQDVIDSIISGYTREAGVRSLEREIGRLVRKVTAKVATGTETPVSIAADELAEWLGRPKVVDDVPDRTNVPGVATGLAVTGAGGDVLFIETTAFPTGPDAEPGLTLTGQLGDVMKESAQIALNYVRSHAEELGLGDDALHQRFHVHVPAGAVPKDGPSAGITMTTALVSLLTGRAVKPTVGMTGEITLQGQVLPIGGVKQKVLAAHRSGLTEVVLPKRNGPDLDDVPERVRDQMTFHLADTYDDVVAAAFAA